MEKLYWIEEWARVRGKELIEMPKRFSIHKSYLRHMEEEFERAFKEIWGIFKNIYDDISKSPEDFKMPLREIDKFGYATKEARESRAAAYRPIKLLYYLVLSGEIDGASLNVDIKEFKSINRVKNIHVLFKRLNDYGFYFQGLKNFKISEEYINVTYPDNQYLLEVLKQMGDKAHEVGRVEDFLVCHYKLFKDDMNTADYGNGADLVADFMNTKQEREFIYDLDEKLMGMGYHGGSRESNEGPGWGYYRSKSAAKNKGPYDYLLSSNKTELYLYLRIRNTKKCLEYIKECPESVKSMFLWGDAGCKNRANGTCKFGQEYEIQGDKYWRCGCFRAPFYIKPRIEDIPHYIKLMEIGALK